MLDIFDYIDKFLIALFPKIFSLGRRVVVRKNVDSEGKVMQEQLYDRFWENTTERIRALGVPELTVNKHLKETQSLSFGSAMSFDINMRESKNHLAGM